MEKRENCRVAPFSALKVIIALYDAVAFAVVSVAILVPQWNLYLVEVNLDFGVFFWAFLLPTILGVVLFTAGRRWVELFAFLAFIWPITEDAPVYLDSVFTWPEVTSGLQHTFLEVLFHLLTLIFLILAARAALGIGKKPPPSRSQILLVAILVFAVFVLCYAQNLPFAQIEYLTSENWYGLDIAEHLAALFLFIFAMYVAQRRGRAVSSELATFQLESP